MYDNWKMYKPDPNFLEWQNYINLNMRSILLNWLMQVSYDFKFKRDTYYYAMNYVDRYLSKNVDIRKEKY